MRKRERKIIITTTENWVTVDLFHIKDDALFVQFAKVSIRKGPFQLNTGKTVQFTAQVVFHHCNKIQVQVGLGCHTLS